MSERSLTLFQIGIHPGATYPDENNMHGTMNTGGIVTFSGSPVTIAVDDDDNIVHDVSYVESPQSPETGEIASLIGDQTIHGGSYTDGQSVLANAQVEVNNLTTGETGFAQIIVIGSDQLGGAFLAFPYAVEPGDELEFIPTNNSNPDESSQYHVTQDFTYDQLTQGTVCYTSGTLIQTKRGLLTVEELKAGDLIATKDNGFQPLAWKYERKLTTEWFKQNPQMAPVTIRSGALGCKNDVTFSPGHMVQLGEDLVAAKHLLSSDLAFSNYSQDRSYFHLLFEDHQLLQTEGLWSESFQPSLSSLYSLGNVRSEIFDIFPDLRSFEGMNDYKSVRPSLYRKRARAAVTAYAKRVA